MLQVKKFIPCFHFLKNRLLISHQLEVKKNKHKRQIKDDICGLDGWMDTRITCIFLRRLSSIYNLIFNKEMGCWDMWRWVSITYILYINQTIMFQMKANKLHELCCSSICRRSKAKMVTSYTSEIITLSEDKLHFQGKHLTV